MFRVQMVGDNMVLVITLC